MELSILGQLGVLSAELNEVQGKIEKTVRIFSGLVWELRDEPEKKKQVVEAREELGRIQKHLEAVRTRLGCV